MGWDLLGAVKSTLSGVSTGVRTAARTAGDAGAAVKDAFTTRQGAANLLKWNPITGPLYWTGAGVNAILNQVGGHPPDTVNPIVKNLSLYNPGPVLGDGRGSLQLPVANSYLQPAVKEVARDVRKTAGAVLGGVSEGLFGVPLWLVLVVVAVVVAFALTRPGGARAVHALL